MRSLDDSLPDTTLWLAPIDAAVEPAVMPAGVSAGEAANSSAPPAAGEGAGKEQVSAQLQPQALGCLPMTLSTYSNLLWQLALESRPELQAREELTREQSQTPVWRDGTPVKLAELEERHRRYGRRCKTQLGQHACRAIRERLAGQRPRPANGRAKGSAPAQPAGAN